MDITSAILAINPDAEVSVNAEDFDQITWHSGTAVISKSDIEKKQKELQVEYDAQAYSRNRAAEYPSIAELTVALYDEDDKAAIETKRAAVKKKWPKDNSGPVE